MHFWVVSLQSLYSCAAALNNICDATQEPTQGSTIYHSNGLLVFILQLDPLINKLLFEYLQLLFGIFGKPRNCHIIICIFFSFFSEYFCEKFSHIHHPGRAKAQSQGHLSNCPWRSSARRRQEFAWLTQFLQTQTCLEKYPNHLHFLYTQQMSPLSYQISAANIWYISDS